MQVISRRAVVKGLAFSVTGWLGACGGGGGDSEAAESTPAVAETPSTAIDSVTPVDSAASSAEAEGALVGKPASPSAQAPTTVVPVGRYRFNQAYLFQNVNSKTIASRLSGGVAYECDVYGPNVKYVDCQTGWLWDRLQGDWLDAKLVRYGTEPWFSASVGGASGGTAIKDYKVDVTGLVKYCQQKSRWSAFLLKARNAPRAIATPFHKTQTAPYIDVTYADGSRAKLACRLVAANTASATGPLTTNESISLPAFIEFEPPKAAITAAVMSFVVTEHWSGNNPYIDGFLLDPPINADPVRQGLAASAGRLDEGLGAKASVIGLHRYLDGTALADFAHPESINFNAERNFDPAIFGTGPQDLTKLPHVGLGKWINTSSNWSLVNSSYRGDGFVPLAPGLGALRIVMPAEPGVADGSIVGSSGTLAANGMIYLPESMFGRLGRIFVRYYFRLGSPYKATAAARKQVYHEIGTTPDWTTFAGKFGITPDHDTSYGGVSGSSGGGGGWQMRHSWYDCDAETNGPDEGGWSVGYHLYDFLYQNPAGHNYGKESPVQEERWGQRGGLGGILYAGQWYCVETELKLNTVMDASPGYLADGELRTWIDGRLAYQRTGMVFRTFPKVDQPYKPDALRPCREIGVRGLWLDWFHGGKTPATFDRTSFYTGLVWSTDYIGPMQL